MPGHEVRRGIFGKVRSAMESKVPALSHSHSVGATSFLGFLMLKCLELFGID